MTKETFIEGLEKLGFEQDGDVFELLPDDTADAFTVSFEADYRFRIENLLCMACGLDDEDYANEVDKCTASLLELFGEEPEVEYDALLDDCVRLSYVKEYDIDFVAKFIIAFE